MRKIALAGAAGLLASIPAAGSAKTVVSSNRASVSSPNGCLLQGNTNTNGGSSYPPAQNAYNAYNDTRPSAGPDIALNPITNLSSLSITGAIGTSGTWSLPGFLVEYFAVKASNNFVLYRIEPASSGSWTTTDIPGRGRNSPELSHLTFFGNPGSTPAVPEPATWATMIMGLGFVAGVMRRSRGRATSVA